MHKIVQSHLLRAFVANLKIDPIYALYSESFCDKNLAIRKVFAFCDSGYAICSSKRKKSSFIVFLSRQNINININVQAEYKSVL